MAPATSMKLALTLLLQALPSSWSAPTALSARQARPPKVVTYPANPNIGPGGDTFKDSPHFRIYGNDGPDAQIALDKLEAAFQCFVRGPFGFTGTGRSFNDPDKTGNLTKTNIYAVASLDSAAGVMHSDFETGMAYVEVVQDYLATSGVTIHEWGHGLHYHQRTWVDQGNTGAWWEMFANWVADTYASSTQCAPYREMYAQESERSSIDLQKTIGDSFQVIVDGTGGSGNYYQSWPFLTYLTNNPDKISNLGVKTLKQMMVQYEEDSNETPLHTLQRVAGATSVAEIVGRYWARMAFVDIGSDPAHETFLAVKDQLNYDNVQGSGSTYNVIADRAPQYMGANIIPLTVDGGNVKVEITAEGGCTAFLAVSSDAGVTYTKLENGSGSADVPAGSEASLTISNTPEQLITYDAFNLNAEVKKGLLYSFTLSGATVA